MPRGAGRCHPPHYSQMEIVLLFEVDFLALVVMFMPNLLRLGGSVNGPGPIGISRREK